MFEKSSRHSFLLENEETDQEVEYGQLKPKEPDGSADEQEKEEEKHPRVRH